VRGMVVAMRREPLGRLIACGDEGDAIDKLSVWAKDEGAGEGSTGATSTLAVGSVGDVNISGMCGGGAWAEDGVGRAERSLLRCCKIVFFIIHTMSWICCSKLGVSLAWLPG